MSYWKWAVQSHAYIIYVEMSINKIAFISKDDLHFCNNLHFGTLMCVIITEVTQYKLIVRTFILHITNWLGMSQ